MGPAWEPRLTAPLRLLSLLGVLLAFVGLGILSAPRVTRRLLAVLGVTWPQPRHERVAAWLLVAIGLVIAVVARLAG